MNDITLWMDPSERDLIIRYLQQTPDSIMLEWGSGGSTVLFPKYVKTYISIEHNLDWYIDVRDKLHLAGLENIKQILIDMPKGRYEVYDAFYNKWKDYLHLVSKEEDNNLPDLDDCISPHARYIWNEYVCSIDTIGVKCYDYILIDGRARIECAYKALDYISTDSVVFIHDFFKRERYHPVLKYYDVVDKVDNTLQTIVALKKKK